MIPQAAARHPSDRHRLRQTSARDFLANNRLWFDGTTLTVLNLDDGIYLKKEIPGSVDAMLDHMAQNEGIAAPLADFGFPNPAKPLLERVESATYVGTSKVLGKPCHHLAFTQEAVNWQIWISEEGTPLPRKLVITYKKLPAQPQYIALFAKWELAVELEDSVFEPVIPDGTDEIRFLSDLPKGLPKIETPDVEAFGAPVKSQEEE